MKPTIDNIIKILSEKGQRQYDCEAVSQLEHALQCATLAEKNRSTKELIIACLLHDLGHLLHDLGEEAAIGGIDDRHEYAAASFLSSKFDPTINFSVQSNFKLYYYPFAKEVKLRSSIAWELTEDNSPT